MPWEGRRPAGGAYNRCDMMARRWLAWVPALSVQQAAAALAVVRWLWPAALLLHWRGRIDLGNRACARPYLPACRH